MYNYKLVIEYDGTDYFGWQRQKATSKTVQETIERSLKRVTGEDVTLIAAGRTDTGVHAMNQAANFKIRNKLNTKNLVYSLNSVLPDSITVKRAVKVKDDFNARYSAKGKEYIYRITSEKKSVGGAYFTRLNYDLNYGIIKELTRFFKGEHSFKSLCKNKIDKHLNQEAFFLLMRLINLQRICFEPHSVAPPRPQSAVARCQAQTRHS